MYNLIYQTIHTGEVMVATYELLKMNLCFVDNIQEDKCLHYGWDLYKYSNNIDNAKYRSSFYINYEAQEMVVVSYNLFNSRLDNGNLMSEMLRNHDILFGDFTDKFYSREVNSIKNIIKSIDDYEKYSYYFTGHLYSAVLADLYAVYLSRILKLGAKSITFNNAGSGDLLIKLYYEFTLPLSNIIIYNTTPNVINIFNIQAGDVYLVDGKKLNNPIILYDISDSLYLMQKLFNSSGEFVQKEKVNFWPILNEDIKDEIQNMLTYPPPNIHDNSFSWNIELDREINGNFYYNYFLSYLFNIDNDRIKLYDIAITSTGLNDLFS
ncbi:hypothetical protein NOVO_00635 [Rickettsiales bacterium Ac37b]|nr:hypothetical protein NOVO_00635 [Rickettsiales bacterium Ac37b]